MIPNPQERKQRTMFKTFKRRNIGAFFMTITKQEDIAYD